VRPGIYHIGGWGYDEDIETLDLPSFWIAKYPITVQQYRYFMQKDGYTKSCYWTSHGWQWKEQRERMQPWGWGKKQFCKNDQPITSMTWYEAAAFAAWLNVQLAAWLPEGYGVRLPTEAEWEAAAAYDEQMHRQMYPWGDDPEPDESRADFGKDWRKVGPLPVGERPDGAAPCGAKDMVGSVWEPTASSYSGYPFKSHIAVNDVAPAKGDFAWRGGAWCNNMANACCATRGRDDPSYKYDDVGGGFRIVLSPLQVG
jgi:formylglycine-generating enzyme required for sulfatase activity